MKTRFGGIGVSIMTYRIEFEIEMNRIDALLEEIGDQNEVVASLYGSLTKLFAGDLQKLANANDLTKNLIACKALLCKANEEITKLKKLMTECGQAQERARRAMPDFAMFFSEGRQDTIPGRTFFTASKDAKSGLIPFAPPAQKQSIDPAASLADVALTRRFSSKL